jgi:thiol:disulfide interchange protein DsbG
MEHHFNMFKRQLLSAAILSLAAASAFASADKVEPLTPYTGTLPPALKLASNMQGGNGLEVFKKFPAAGNLDGWVVQDKRSHKNIIVYTSKDGKVLIAGMMLDENGQNLSAQYTAANVPPAAEPDYVAALSEFKSGGVLVGNPKAKAEITVVFDANCHYCKDLEKVVAPAIDAGALRVNYVPVAILTPDSLTKGAAFLAAKDPKAAMAGIISGNAAVSNDQALSAKVMANTGIMKKYDFSGTPAVLYMGTDKGDKTVFTAGGVPNFVEMYKRLGLDDKLLQPAAQDPSLARYVSR